MSSFLVAISMWLHNIASAIFIGYFLLVALITLPALQAAPPDVRGTLLSAISRRSRPRLYASLVVFALTGAYLTLVDPSYMGLGNFRSPWTILMLVKHTVILVMLGIGFWFNALWRVGPMCSSNTGAAQAAARFRSYVYWMAACGLVVLLLTAIAQAGQ